jgi:phenylpropionate dioxygenase-like ring-hydroxylating dioxygenase large terminal subunit
MALAERVVVGTLKDRLYHGAYPTHEYGSVVFAYMGPPDRQPPFPVYDSFVRPGYRLIPGQKYFYPCNWLQIMENAMDPAHTAFLHTIISGSQFIEEFGVMPELEFVETPVGVMYIATRPPPSRRRDPAGVERLGDPGVGPLATMPAMIGASISANSSAFAGTAAWPSCRASSGFVRLPSSAPRAFLAASASLVRSLIRRRSISAKAAA